MIFLPNEWHSLPKTSHFARKLDTLVNMGLHLADLLLAYDTQGICSPLTFCSENKAFEKSWEWEA